MILGNSPFRSKIMFKRLQELVTTPIFVFQMGKVGSTSLTSTLSNRYHGLVKQAHNEQMLTEKQKTRILWRNRLKLPIYVICPVREPLSRNLSAFFENFCRDTGLNFSDKEWTSDELLDLFLKHYPHNVCLEWFDNSLRTTFGIDVFSQPFPTKQKWQIYKYKSIRVLIYRSDLDHSKQLDIVSKFVGQELSEWSYSNISASKEYAEIYKRFISSVKLPDIYISIMCNSKFCRQFWSKEEVEMIKERFKA